MRGPGPFVFGMSLLLLAALLVPFAGALDTAIQQSPPDLLARDNPVIIGALRYHTADLAGLQDARMNGVIRYVRSLGDGSAAENLAWIQEDYLTVASSVPVMVHADDIDDARKTMSEQSVRFSDETAHQLALLGGNVDTMQGYINDSLQAFGLVLSDRNATPWLTTGRARMKVFQNGSGQRNATLAELSTDGADISRAREISGEIDGERENLQEVLGRRSSETITAINGRLRILNQQYRDAVLQCRADLEIRNRTAAMLAMRD